MSTWAHLRYDWFQLLGRVRSVWEFPGDWSSWKDLWYALVSTGHTLLMSVTQPWAFLTNVWAYRKELWRDRDWNEGPLFFLMARKLRRMGDSGSNPARPTNFGVRGTRR